MKKTSVSLELAGKTLTLETGVLAPLATSAILARIGDTEILVTVVEGKTREDLGYFPLTVEYIERLYAGGRIKGSRWVKREGRPSEDAILTARLIDRSVRPLFPKEYKKEVQIMITVLSVDGQNEPDVLAIVGTSAALAISKIPWMGPIGAVRVGLVKEKENGNAEYLINPGTSESEFSELDLVVTQTSEKTIMLEAGAKQVQEKDLKEGISKALEYNQKIIKFLQDFAKEVGTKKETVSPNPLILELTKRIEKTYKTEILSFIAARVTKEAVGNEFENLIDKIFEEEHLANPESEIDKKMVAEVVEKIFYKGIRESVVKTGKRPDGRVLDQIRPISASVSILPRTHGSGIFQRGDTQALTVATLGSPRMEQLIESAEGEESKSYMHHYSMPPYSVGETGRVGVPSRREIGHGALAERALLPVIPSRDKFPYTIRVVSEILSSNGSTSMAAVCGSTLSLMDAGVPIEKPVAGVAMGLMSTEEKYVILTDILGLEDFSGEMDFKVAGTADGITAVQLDVKNLGITVEQIEEILERAKIGRIFILGKIEEVLPAVRPKLSEFAPKIELIHIPVEKIGEVIGPGGKIIRNIISETGATVDVEDDGSVTISATSEESVQKAVDWVKGLTREVQAGEVFDGEVKRILPFGAFVEILPGKEGMVHVSQMAPKFVKDPTEIVSIGQKVKVRVMEIDEQGRINLSMLFGQDAENRASSAKPPHPLAMQFRREKAGFTRGRTSGPRFRRPR